MMNNSIDKETEKIINANEYIAVRKNYDHQFSSYYGVLADEDFSDLIEAEKIHILNR